MPTKKRPLDHPGLAPLWHGLRREWRLQLVSFIGLLLLGVGFTLVGAIGPSAILTGIGIVLGVVGAILLVRHLLRRGTRHRLVELLHERPEEIVWVYSVVTRRRPYGIQVLPSGTMYFKLIDGDDITVGIDPEQLKLVSQILNRVLPRAVFGYSEERARLYARDPASLLREM